MAVKPTAKNTVPILECVPCDISGISSSTTTYSMAPAAKLKRYGSAGTMSWAAKTVSTAPMGYTAPESTPSKNARDFFMPSACNGMEMMAPSGKF